MKNILFNDYNMDYSMYEEEALNRLEEELFEEFDVGFEVKNSEQMKKKSELFDSYFEDKDLREEFSERYNEIVTNLIEWDLESEADNLKYALKALDHSNGYIVIADLRLWNGRRAGYKLADYVENMLSFQDYNIYFVDRYNNFKAKQIHHDGTNNLLFRAWKDNISEEQKDNFTNKIYEDNFTSNDISRYTVSLGKDLKKYLGFQ